MLFNGFKMKVSDTNVLIDRDIQFTTKTRIEGSSEQPYIQIPEKYCLRPT